MSERTCLAIDIGGTKLAVGLVDEDGSLLSRRQVPTPHETDPDLVYSELVALCEEVLDAAPHPPELIGVGCGGPMEPEGAAVSPLNIPAWRRFPLASRLAESIGLPVFVDNDGKALALGEGWRGAAREVDSFMAMVVSTGIGGGIVLNGRLLDGRLGNAGHIGHLVVVPGGRQCACGVKGCLEAEASGMAIEAITGRPAREASPTTVTRTGEMVGHAVASVATLLDLNLCVVAGSVALGFGKPFFRAAQATMERETGLSYTEGAKIVPAGLGDEGPLIGAAAVGFLAQRERVLVS